MLRTTAIVSLGLCVCVWMAGCDSSPPEPDTHQDEESHEGHTHEDELEHAHPTEGPHGGHLVELGGEEYYAELLHDESTHTVTVHLLGAAAEESVLVETPEITLQVLEEGQFADYALTAVAAGGDATGASQFEIVDQHLSEMLDDAEQLRGRLRVTIEGRQLTGTIEHHAH